VRTDSDAPSVTLDQPRRTLQVFARGENKVVVVDLWESEEDFHRMADDPEIQRNVEAAPEQPARPLSRCRARRGFQFREDFVKRTLEFL
jgi:heme-degrading monooxygenase HmoA